MIQTRTHSKEAYDYLINASHCNWLANKTMFLTHQTRTNSSGQYVRLGIGICFSEHHSTCRTENSILFRVLLIQNLFQYIKLASMLPKSYRWCLTNPNWCLNGQKPDLNTIFYFTFWVVFLTAQDIILAGQTWNWMSFHFIEIMDRSRIILNGQKSE